MNKEQFLDEIFRMSPSQRKAVDVAIATQQIKRQIPKEEKIDAAIDAVNGGGFSYTDYLVGELEVTKFERTEETARRLYERLADDLELTFSDDYSGRAMYGETCWGVSGDARDAEIGFTFFEAAVEEGMDPTDYEEVRWVRSLLPLRTDSMGRGVIWYNPSVPRMLRNE